jgi:hypothetical protein
MASVQPLCRRGATASGVNIVSVLHHKQLFETFIIKPSKRSLMSNYFIKPLIVAGSPTSINL